ncbi:MAG: DNA-binding response regulator, partial [Methylobacterium sp.]|nr:DNA-binding response regulator [Methylobacterium sp.]
MAAQPARKPLPDEAPHILVVDDDRRLRDLLARFLGDNGYRVTTAANAAEADQRLARLVFDAIVLDIMMPGENGFDFARRFRTDSAVPILMLTARADGKDRINGLEIGVDDYLAKPFEPRELLLRLGNILKRTMAAEPAQAARPDFVRFGPFLYGLSRG